MATRAIRMTGLADMKAAMRRGEKLFRQGVAAGIYALGNEVMTDAKKRSPVDLGTMRGSGYVTEPKDDGKTIELELGFGGPASDYVVRQHEDLGLRHTVGEAKFLERAFDASSGSRGRIAAQVAREVVEAGGGGIGPGAHPKAPGGA